MPAEFTPKPIKLLREKPNIIFHQEPDISDENSEVLYRDTAVLVTKATEKNKEKDAMREISMLYADPYYNIIRIPELFSKPSETVTVSDIETGLPDCSLKIRRRLLGGPKVENVTVWDYLVSPDEGEAPGQPIVSVRKTEIRPKIFGYTEKENLSELPLHEDLPITIEEKEKRHLRKDSEKIEIVNDVIEQLRKVKGLSDLKNLREPHRKSISGRDR